MHKLEPHLRWESFYDSSMDPDSPFFGKEYNYDLYSENIYGYYIDPGWDFMGSETLYLKILYIDDDESFCVIQLIGEWNDAINNDIMYFKRNILDPLMLRGIKRFALIGDYVFNFHGSDDCYYEEWKEELAEEGWIVALNFRDLVESEWNNYGLAAYMFFGEGWEFENWRTMSPLGLLGMIQKKLASVIG